MGKEFKSLSEWIEEDIDKIDVSGVKEFVRLLKEIKKSFCDIAVVCPICNKEKRLWVKNEDICYECKINQLAGPKLI